VTFHPAALGAVVFLSLLAAFAESFLDSTPEFCLGLFIGEIAVLATIALNSLVLLWGGEHDWHTLVLVTWVVHLPLAVLEGIILGFTVGFLARVKPELIGLRRKENQPCLVESAT
jgi:ABC-type Co2+ transport system permease subunit